ncbi:AfsA-related hotdog domain-containing protein [Vibrio cionasavignyae]|uniref:AfsA-related hotdog domain-containing protein n=1 Tax=Vibrio cionasavignyae TaxID=2910252 RepID=UPI003D0E326D
MSVIPPISPKLMHKHKADDVLLSDPRKLLPVRFTSSQENIATDPAIVMLNSLYEPLANNEYVLRLPKTMSGGAGVSFDEVIALSANDPMRGVPAQIVESIRAGLPQDTAERIDINDENVSAFLTHHKVARHSHSFQFVNRGDHYFFYRKPHEHVPGIMLLEAARQTIYYQLYSFSQQQLGQVTVSLNELNAKFYNYAELMYPIEIVVDDLTLGDTQKPKEVLYSASFYQKGILIARINSLAPVISLKRFKMARNVNLFGEEERFSPLSIAPITALLSSGCGKQALVDLQDIGLSGCKTSAISFDNEDSVYLNLIYDNKLHFTAKLQHERDEQSHVSWLFNNVSYEEIETLKEIIKRSFLKKL